MIDPSRARVRTQGMKTASEKARQKTKAFLRKTEYQLYRNQGLPMDEAARRVGIKIPFGRFFTQFDIMKKIEEGK